MKRFLVTIEGLSWDGRRWTWQLPRRQPNEGDSIQTQYGACLVTKVESLPQQGRSTTARSCVACRRAGPQVALIRLTGVLARWARCGSGLLSLISPHFEQFEMGAPRPFF